MTGGDKGGGKGGCGGGAAKSGGGGGGHQMSQSDAARIQSAEARAGGGGVEKGGFASRAQAAADSRAAQEGKNWEEVRLSAGAISGGGGLVGGNSGGSGGSGGGGKGGDGSGSGGSGMPEPVIGWKGWQDRVAVDPQFAYKMMIELLIGVTSMVAGDLLTRPNYGLDELDLVFATVIVGSIANFSAVYLLAPVAVSAGGAARQGLFQKLFGSYFLNRWGAPASHMFQPGFGLGQRATNFLYKGAVFSVIGMGAGVIGTALSNALLLLRKRMNPAFRPQSEPPSVMGNAAAWSLHMALSANSRYQLLNGLDMALQPLMPMSLFRLYTLAVRGANNVLGGITFVMLAKAVGAQKSAASAPHTPGAPAGRRVRKKK